MVRGRERGGEGRERQREKGREKESGGQRERQGERERVGREREVFPVFKHSRKDSTSR